MIKAAFAETLRRYRQRRTLTQEKLALESGISLRYLQDLEAGHKLPTIATVFRLASALQTTPQTLLNLAWKRWLDAGKP